jgi:ligand-binding sensor domain-containing protein/serine phosphatase RsbU (regulator of sigma subunit)
LLRIRKINILVILLGTLLLDGGAQKINFKNYTVREGLPQNSVQCIAQDFKGYMWFGTQGGAVRFDGKNFMTLTRSNGLPDNSISDIMEDSHHRLWFSTSQGIARYDGFNFQVFNKEKGLIDNDVYKTFEDSHGNIWALSHFGLSLISGDKISSFDSKNGLPHNNVMCLTEDSKGNIWCGTQNGIAVFSNERIIRTYQSEIQYSDNGQKVAPVWSIHEDSKGKIWIALQENGVFIFDGKAFSHFTMSNGLASNTVISIFEDAGHTLWFGTYGKGLTNYDGKQFHVLKSPGLENSFFMNFAQDRNGDIWCTTNNNGIFLYRNGEFAHYKTTNNLADDVTTDLFCDSEGNIWIGTSGGASMYGKGLFELYTTDEGLFNNNVIAVLADRSGDIWSSSGAGLVKYSKNGLSAYSSAEILHESTGETANKQFLSLYQDHKGTVWIGTWSALAYYERNGFRKLDEDRIPGIRKALYYENAIYDVEEDSKGNYWYATERGLYKRTGNSLTQYNIESGLVDNYVNAVLEDKDHNIWVGTTAGISIFDGQTFINYPADSLPNELCTGLAMDSTGNIWVATEGGICRFTKIEKNKYNIKVYTTADGLASNINYLVEADRAGHIWVGGLKGLNRLTISNDEITYYGPDDGFPIETNQNAVSIDPKGNLWFGTVYGLVKYDPTRDVVNRQPPSTYISSIQLIGRDETAVKYAQATDSLTHLPVKLKLPHNRNFLRFDYIAVHFTIPEKVRYQYKLEGFDEAWSPITIETSVEYKKLPHGKYTFLVKASNSDGIWNESPASFKFEISPPFYKTAWFILLEIAAGVFLVVLIIRVRESKLQNDKKILEQKVLERTAEIERQKSEIQDKNEELIQQQHEILAQRDEIERQRDVATAQRDQISFQKKEITDSIHYARRIQTAILTSEEYARSVLGEYFILFKPRDIVSGDFYWMAKKGNKTIVVAADCTGHGVPGAFMSMLGVSLLNEIVNKEDIHQANEILNKLRSYVKATLSQTGKENEAKDGMDIAICVIDYQQQQVEFAGANNPLYIIRNGELIESKADNMPIGIHAGEERLFKNNILPLVKEDFLYIFSDGYADQFGGPDGSKFKAKPFKRLLTEIASYPASEQKNILDRTIEKWKGNLDQVDDILVIGMKF